MRDVSAAVGTVCEGFGLGALVAIRAELHGGVNRLWQVETARGTFAIHQLLGIPADVDPFERCDRIQDLELAASAGGVPLPAPVPEPATGSAAIAIDGTEGVFVTHRWVEAPVVDPALTGAPLAHSLGVALGRLHRLDVAPEPLEGDVLERRLQADEWSELARAAAGAALPWAGGLDRAAADLAAASVTVDAWEAGSPSTRLWSHRDLTPDNVLDDRGTAVLIDWESAGPILRSSEIGRTALDHFLRGDRLEPTLLGAFLHGYREVVVLPPVAPDWCSLWVRGMLVFAEHCARSCIAGGLPPSLLAFQSEVVTVTPAEVARRLLLVDRLVEQFAELA